jgi:hypothetical protein
MPRVNNEGFPIKRQGFVHTLDSIKERTIEEGDCWLWRGAYSHRSPALRHEGKVLPVRRFVAQHLLGLDTYKRFAHVKCGNLECVCPDHIQVVTRAKLQKATADRLKFHTRPDRVMKISLSAKARHNRTQEQIDAIKNATGSIRQIARELGFTFSVVQKIRNGTSYREASNPFLGLMK